MIRAVIFDMDGVLIDSEPVYLKYQQQKLSQHYPWVTLESMYPLVGMNSTEDKRFLAQLTHNDPQDPVFLAELAEMNAGCTVYYPDILRPGVAALLDTLRGMGLQVALASSSSAECIATVLSQCGLTEKFDSIVSGYQFRESKPNPEIYLHTMQKLGRTPAECLIVEDSTYGVAAGATAGATVAALRDDRFPFDQTRAQLHLQSLAEIPGAVRRGGRAIKAVFFDVDGTLISISEHTLPTSVYTVLQELRDRGIAAILSTGRQKFEIAQERLLPGLEFDGYIYMNGQLCTLGDQVVLENCITSRELCALREFLDQTGRSCIFLEKNEIYCNRVDERMIREQERIRTTVPPVRSLQGLEQRSIYQVIPFVLPEEEAELLRRMPGCKTLRWGDAVVDLANAAGKEAGVLAVCEALGISPQETMAFGDAENDLGMLRLAGIGVAMGNAEPEAKAAADYVADPLEANGILNALKYYGVL